MEKGTISNISVEYDITLLKVNKAEFSKINDTVNALSEAKINIGTIMMTQTLKDSSSLLFSLKDEDTSRALDILKQSVEGEFDVKNNNAKIIIHGNGFKNPLSGINDILDTIVYSGIEIKQFSTTDTELAIIVEKSEADRIIDILKPFE
ncbi:MAG: hypothetical protein E7391_01000 [Ruminococcaceae bacterium]|nr:hypothetical protein [Oscillospiraceae bacterium]